MKPLPSRVGRLSAIAALLGLALAAGALPFAVQPARAANLTVNTIGDGADQNAGDGVSAT